MKTIAIGVGDNDNIIQACHIFKKKHPKTNIKLIYEEKDLVNSVLNSRIHAVIRGSLPSSTILQNLKDEFPKLSRATYINKEGHEFLLTPVGIDEGKTVEEKFEIVKYCIEFFKEVGKKPKIGVLSQGRQDDFGRSEEISKSLLESEELTKQIEDNFDVDITNYQILIEKAIKDKCNIIIPPNGIIGNIIFRTMVLVNSWPSYGAISFGMDKLYIDTSRDQSIQGYVRSLTLANKLIKEYNSD